MFEYAICNIAGKQYKVVPGKELEVALQDNVSEITAKVLIKVDKDKVEVGTPYLKEELKLKVLGNVSKPKIRVAKFHAKANYRRVTGMRPKATKVLFEA